MKTLTTPRMILRDFSPGDAGDLYAYAQNPNVGPRAGWSPHQSMEESAEVISNFIQNQDVWAIEDRQSQRVIGSVGLHKNPLRNYPSARELGYVLAEEYWGQGRMVEVCRGVLAYAFGEMGLTIVQIAHSDTNHQSKRVIEKLGFTFEGRVRQKRQLADGSFVNICIYSMTKEEYEAIINL